MRQSCIMKKRFTLGRAWDVEPGAGIAAFRLWPVLKDMCAPVLRAMGSDESRLRRPLAGRSLR